MAGLFCHTHGKATIKSLFNTCAWSVLQFEKFYHFKGDLLALPRGAGSEELLSKSGRNFHCRSGHDGNPFLPLLGQLPLASQTANPH